MSCNCRKSITVRNLVTAESGKGGANASNADVNEKTDRKTKLKILREMWEEAKRKKSNSEKKSD